MRYIDWNDVTRRYSDVAREVDATELSEGWINDAEDEIDAHLATRYAVPVANTPSFTPNLVRGLVIDLTYYKYTLGKADNEDLKKSIYERLEKLQNGTMILTMSGSSLERQQSLAWSDRSDYHSAFGPDNELNFRTSSQWLLDAADQRGTFP